MERSGETGRHNKTARYVRTKTAVRWQHRHHHRLHAAIMKIEDPAVIVAEFEGLVNMAARELEAWLESEASRCPAWAGDELIALENGRIVLDILRRNPARNWELYTKGDVEHMRRVVCYCTRQYDLPNNGTNRDRNLKNWGHDVNKALQQVDRLGVESAE